MAKSTPGCAPASRIASSGTCQGREVLVIHSMTTLGLYCSPKPGALVMSSGSPFARYSGSRCVRNGHARTANAAQSRWLGGSLEVRLTPHMGVGTHLIIRGA